METYYASAYTIKNFLNMLVLSHALRQKTIEITQAELTTALEQWIENAANTLDDATKHKMIYVIHGIIDHAQEAREMHQEKVGYYLDEVIDNITDLIKLICQEALVLGITLTAFPFVLLTWYLFFTMSSGGYIVGFYRPNKKG